MGMAIDGGTSGNASFLLYPPPTSRTVLFLCLNCKITQETDSEAPATASIETTSQAMGTSASSEPAKRRDAGDGTKREAKRQRVENQIGVANKRSNADFVSEYLRPR